MTRVPLTKMHGARNDFVVVDLRAADVLLPGALAVSVCDRRSGIGADGLLVIDASDVAGARMRVYNADGSEAEMCGNGVRCVARFLDEAGEGDRLRIETAAGIVETAVTQRAPDYLVRVSMPAPVLKERSHPFERATFVSIGNPHIVVFVTDLEAFDLDGQGGRLQEDVRFPGGVNVHAVTVAGDGSLRVRHWERGVGSTQACGTGAVAAAAAAIAAGLSTSPVRVEAPGGTLKVEWDGSGAVFLTGPAVRVFDTTIEVPESVRA
ncbi:MAG: diaminopimelate epimerase [Vulcanimicrobiaceae bacterium]